VVRNHPVRLRLSPGTIRRKRPGTVYSRDG